MAEPKTIQCGGCSPPTLVATEAGEAGLHGDVVEAVEIVDEVETRTLADDADMCGAQPKRRSVIHLGDVVTEQPDATGAGTDLRCHRRHQRRLARSTRPADDDPLSGIDPEGEAAERGDVVGSSAVQHERVLDVDHRIVRRQT